MTKTANNQAIPAWFNNAIISGVQRLVALSLNGQPPSETIALTATAWTETLWNANIHWQEEVDEARIYATFTKLNRQVDRWPAPKHFLELLMPRISHKELAPPRLTAEQKKQQQAMLKRLKKAFIKRAAVP